MLKQTRAQYIYAEDGVSNHGYRLGMLDIVANYRMYDTFLEDLERVTRQDIQRVAAKYLSENNRIIGWFIPSDGAERAGRGKASANKSSRHRRG